jgi:hypothetical protein
MSRHFIFAFFLVTMLYTSCARPAILPGTTDNEGHVVDVSGLDNCCQDLIQHLKRAKDITSELSKFEWTEFAGVGVVLPPPGICATGVTYLAEKNSVPDGLRWVPLTQQLSFVPTAKNFAVSYNNYLSLAQRVCSAGAELSLAERHELCDQLESALVSANYLVSGHKNVVAYQVVPEIEAQFSRSDERIREKYLGRFKTKCGDYFALLDSLLYYTGQAQQVASILSGG